MPRIRTWGGEKVKFLRAKMFCPYQEDRWLLGYLAPWPLCRLGERASIQTLCVL